jgi:cell fate (sporulation/competence/biofilm development) regulator YlbF (YheA/YmcA/DUF963 family)
MTAAIEDKIQALCETIAADEDVQTARMQAERFLTDDKGVALLRNLMTLSREVQHRQHHGEEVADEQLQQLVELKSEADNHEGIQSFHEAQDVLQTIIDAVNGFVTKTVERGRIPTHDEVFGSGGCGEGCGCHH